MVIDNGSLKSELLALIRRAKSSHIRWRAYAQGLVSGIDIEEDRLPVLHTDCAFGKWYYGDGQQLFGHMQIFADIERPHELLHSVYAQIHKAVSQGDMDAAHEKFQKLVEISRGLLEQIELLERNVESMPEEELAPSSSKSAG